MLPPSLRGHSRSQIPELTMAMEGGGGGNLSLCPPPSLGHPPAPLCGCWDLLEPSGREGMGPGPDVATGRFIGRNLFLLSPAWSREWSHESMNEFLSIPANPGPPEPRSPALGMMVKGPAGWCLHPLCGSYAVMLRSGIRD